LKNYLSDEFDRENSLKRGGQIEFVALDSKVAKNVTAKIRQIL